MGFGGLKSPLVRIGLKYQVALERVTVEAAPHVGRSFI